MQIGYHATDPPLCYTAPCMQPQAITRQEAWSPAICNRYIATDGQLLHLLGLDAFLQHGQLYSRTELAIILTFDSLF